MEHHMKNLGLTSNNLAADTCRGHQDFFSQTVMEKKLHKQNAQSYEIGLNSNNDTITTPFTDLVFENKLHNHNGVQLVNSHHLSSGKLILPIFLQMHVIVASTQRSTIW